jgi:hypothetical protein
VSCIIADGVFSFPIDVGDELGIPVIHFRTISACSFWAYFRILDIIEAGELPIRGIYSFPHSHSLLRKDIGPCMFTLLFFNVFYFLT